MRHNNIHAKAKVPAGHSVSRRPKNIFRRSAESNPLLLHGIFFRGYSVCPASVRLSRVGRPASVVPRRSTDDELEDLFEKLAQMPVLDARSPDEIIGYGPDGLPH